MQSDDDPLQAVDIANPEITHLTLKGMDRHSHYQFQLMARTAAGKGLAIEILGATTLEGCKSEAHSGTQWPLPSFGHFV